jgi:hypothetical protein
MLTKQNSYYVCRVIITLRLLFADCCDFGKGQSGIAHFLFQPFIVFLTKPIVPRS